MIVNICEEGEVRFERSLKAKRLRLTVSLDSVRVSIPKGVSLETAKAFAEEHTEWIRHHAGRLKKRQELGMHLVSALPAAMDPEEARQKIIYRCRLLSMETGLGFSRLTIREQKTRWGSCSSTNAISLNIALARLPQHLMDYVILHELVHTRVRGHGPRFWKELDRYVGNSRMLSRELRRYPISSVLNSSWR